MFKRSRTLQTRLDVARMLPEHASYQEIADTVHVSSKIIATVSQLIDDHRPIETPRPRGRLSKLLPPVIATVRNKAFKCPFIGGAKFALIMESELGIHISRQTIDCIRRRVHFRCTSPCRRPMLSVTQRQKRVDFCRNALEEERGAGRARMQERDEPGTRTHRRKTNALDGGEVGTV
jgi:hypothetical protein